MPKLYSHQYTVTGRYPFPMDMLRYDASHPASEHDSYLITDATDGMSRGTEALGQVEITLRSFSTNRHWTPTAGRWESFSWRVVGMTSTREI